FPAAGAVAVTPRPWNPTTVCELGDPERSVAAVNPDGAVNHASPLPVQVSEVFVPEGTGTELPRIPTTAAAAVVPERSPPSTCAAWLAAGRMPVMNAVPPARFSALGTHAVPLQ